MSGTQCNVVNNAGNNTVTGSSPVRGAKDKKLSNMKIKQLTKFFEDNGFNVSLFKEEKTQVAELEIWTSGGVDMIILLRPFTKEEFVSYVNDFNVDEQITTYRQAEDYCNVFTIRKSLEDFEEFHNLLKSIASKL